MNKIFNIFKIISKLNLLNKIRKSKFLKSFYKYINKKHHLQEFNAVKGYEIIRLGSEYGGWYFVDEVNLKNSTIISAGLGEDASFDLEFARKYNAKVIIIDPTPRAIKHFQDICQSLGKFSETKYLQGGAQPISSYNLSNLKRENFLFLDKALWNKKDSLRFFAPNNAKHVSHSIINYQNNYKKDTSFINVEAIAIDDLLKELDLDPEEIPLMKLDIEGAEIEFLSDCLIKGFKPCQILVEFDELHKPQKRGLNRFIKINDLLFKNGYKLLKSSKTDFLYYKKK